METVIDANTTLDYIEFRIFPTLNRYEAWIYCDNKKENVASGTLEHLLRHSAEAKSLHTKGSNSKFALSTPTGIPDVKWFTKSTLIRFLQILGSPSILEATKSLKKEIFQLEQTQTFHLSLYKNGGENQTTDEDSGNSYSNGIGVPQNAEGSHSSKNALLQAVDLRLSALRGELIASFDQVAGSRNSMEDIIDLQKFAENFGSADLSDALVKYIELRQMPDAVATLSSKRSSDTKKPEPEESSGHASESPLSELRVEYSASPAKAVVMERQNSTDDEKSSASSEEEQPCVERSRTLARSFSPRRSASPMRIQIGRSGSRRSTAITIKSLNYFPARGKSFMTRGADSDSGGEESERTTQKPETNVKRMSVQDAIHLFESRQRDQVVDVHKVKPSGTISVGPNKSVLRRWSSGVVEGKSSSQDIPVASAMKVNHVDRECEEGADVKHENEVIPVVSEDKPIDRCSDVKLNSNEEVRVSEEMQVESCLVESTGTSDRLVTSSEWSQQKEAELNELMMKMMESKPVKKLTGLASAKTVNTEKKGDFYDRYKEKRDEKLLASATRNLTDKKKPLKAVQKIGEPKKSQVASVVTSDAGKKIIPKKLPGLQKNKLEPANKTGSDQVGVVKKAAPKASSLPATRKSWPSPSTRMTSGSPAKTSGVTSSTGKLPTRRKSEATPSTAQSSPKVETTSVKAAKSVKPNLTVHRKSSGSGTGKKQQPLVKPGKMADSKPQTSSDTLATNSKPSKVTKKSAVVPLEPKPFLRKGSGTTPVADSDVNKESSSDFQESSRTPEDLTLVEKHSNSCSELVIEKEGVDSELDVDATDELDTTATSPQKFEKEDLGRVEPVYLDSMHSTVAETELEKDNEEELSISPTAWVELEEPENDYKESGDHVPQTMEFPAHVSALSPRVRHSLSQMLLEETNEHDVGDWGNAENPQPLVSQKDAPKGLKKLLNFARKSKTDANSTGWSTPSVISEGEDDAEDPRFVNKRNNEKLLRKGTQHSKNIGHQKSGAGDEKSGGPGKSKLNGQSFQRDRQESNVSASVTTVKAKSFFSLSAFKSSK